MHKLSLSGPMENKIIMDERFALLSLSGLTFCILMDFPIHIDTISKGLLILYFKGSQVESSKL